MYFRYHPGDRVRVRKGLKIYFTYHMRDEYGWKRMNGISYNEEVDRFSGHIVEIERCGVLRNADGDMDYYFVVGAPRVYFCDDFFEDAPAEYGEDDTDLAVDVGLVDFTNLLF